MAGTLCGLHSAHLPRRTARSCHRCQLSRQRNSHKMSCHRLVHRHRRMWRTSRLIQQMPRHTECTLFAMRSPQCRQGIEHRCPRFLRSPPHSPDTSAGLPKARIPQHTDCISRSRQPTQAHTAGMPSCRHWAQCHRRKQHRCHWIRRSRQSSSSRTPQTYQARCLAHTPRRRHPCQQILMHMAGTLCGLHSAPVLRCTGRTVHRCPRSQSGIQRKLCSPRWAQIHRHIRRRCRPSRLTPHRRVHTTHGLQWAPCLEYSARTLLQMSGHGGAPDSHPRSQHRQCGWRSAPVHSDMRRTADRRHSQLRLQSARTSHRHPHRRLLAETVHHAGREDVIQADS